MLRRLGMVFQITLIAGTSWALDNSDLDSFEKDVSSHKSYFQLDGAAADLDSIFPKGRRFSLKPSLSVEAAYSDNVDKEMDAVEAFMSKGKIGLEAVSVSPRLRSSADYSYQAPLYSSESVSDRELAGHDIAAAVKWMPAKHFNLSGGGYRLQNTNNGLMESLPGVTSTYENRADEYNANAAYSWTMSDKVKTKGGYEYSYRDYASNRTEGEDSRFHRANAEFEYEAPQENSLALGYLYFLQDRIKTDEESKEHNGFAVWTRTFRNFPGMYKKSSLSANYRANKGMPFTGSNYLDHSLAVSPTLGATANSDVGLVGAYRIISRERKEDIRIWLAGLDLKHRFSTNSRLGVGGSYEAMLDEELDSRKNYWQGRASWSKEFSERASAEISYAQSLEYLPESEEIRRTNGLSSTLRGNFSKNTSASFSLSNSWEDLPSSSRSDVTTSTLTKKASAQIDSRLSERFNLSIGGECVSGKPDDSDSMGDFWYGQGNVALTGHVARSLSLGGESSFNRRQTNNSDEDYLLQQYNVFVNHSPASRLSWRLLYSYENRTYDEESRLFWYHEHYVGVKATAAW